MLTRGLWSACRLRVTTGGSARRKFARQEQARLPRKGTQQVGNNELGDLLRNVRAARDQPPRATPTHLLARPYPVRYQWHRPGHLGFWRSSRMTQPTWFDICCYWLETWNRTPVLGNSEASVRRVGHDSIRSTRCSHWIHRRCTNLSNKTSRRYPIHSHIASSAARVRKPEEREPEEETNGDPPSNRKKRELKNGKKNERKRKSRNGTEKQTKSKNMGRNRSWNRSLEIQ